MPSFVVCRKLSCSRWFPLSFLCHPATFCFVVLLIFSFSAATLNKKLEMKLAAWQGICLVGLVFTPRERKIPGSNPACAGILPGRVIPVTSKLALQWLPCQAPGVIGSVLGLVGAASVYCGWVRWKVGSAISVSVWQHVKLSEQIRP